MILVTGVGGFIGYHMARRLLESGIDVLGLDRVETVGLTAEEQKLRHDRLRTLSDIATHTDRVKLVFTWLDLSTDRHRLTALFKEHPISCVIHLAARAGVRQSITEPTMYVYDNIIGTTNLLTACAHGVPGKPTRIVMASTSSVYGETTLPMMETWNADRPSSPYAATKRGAELMAHAYAKNHGVPVTVARLFTVYGPWGRPDMALTKFAHALVDGRPVELYNGGDHVRDFTYIDDVVTALQKLTQFSPEGNYQVYNVGSGYPKTVRRYLECLESALGIKATLTMLPKQAGDVRATHADVEKLYGATGFLANTPIESGVSKFVHWYRGYYGVSCDHVPGVAAC